MIIVTSGSRFGSKTHCESCDDYFVFTLNLTTPGGAELHLCTKCAESIAVKILKELGATENM